MQFRKPFKQAIARGEIDLSFRSWKSPQAKEGGQYNIAPYGAIEVLAMSQVRASSIVFEEAERAGFESVERLFKTLKIEPADVVWRVTFRYLGTHTVNQPEKHQLAVDELSAVLARLQRLDKNAPWTFVALELIEKNPGRRAGDLCVVLELETQVFKRKVRQLKSLGLTESLEVGYRLSARGKQVLKALRTPP